MTEVASKAEDERVSSAIAELQGLIRHRWPSAKFDVTRGEDPVGVYLGVVVDIEDTDMVMDAVAERLLEVQVDQGLPVYLIAVRPLERVLEKRRRE